MKVLFSILVIMLSGCGTRNLAESSTENTKEEKARIALNEENWDLAIQLYTELIAEDATIYKFHPLLGTCYAGRAGVDLLNIVKAQFSSGTSASGGIFDTIGAFLPKDPTDAQMSDIITSINTISSMPEDHRSKTGTFEYSSEASFQLDLYTASHSGMFVNKFSEATETGELNQEKLQEMSEEEVDALLSNLDNVANGDDELAEGVSEALEGINGQEGANSKEKLINYLNSTNSG